MCACISFFVDQTAQVWGPALTPTLCRWLLPGLLIGVASATPLVRCNGCRAHPCRTADPHRGASVQRPQSRGTGWYGRRALQSTTLCGPSCVGKTCWPAARVCQGAPTRVTAGVEGAGTAQGSLRGIAKGRRHRNREAACSRSRIEGQPRLHCAASAACRAEGSSPYLVKLHGASTHGPSSARSDATPRCVSHHRDGGYVPTTGPPTPGVQTLPGQHCHHDRGVWGCVVVRECARCHCSVGRSVQLGASTRGCTPSRWPRCLLHCPCWSVWRLYVVVWPANVAGVKPRGASGGTSR